MQSPALNNESCGHYLVNVGSLLNPNDYDRALAARYNAN